MVAKEDGLREMGWVAAVRRCKLLYRGWINNRSYCTGNYIQHPVMSHNGEEHQKECTYG